MIQPNWSNSSYRVFKHWKMDMESTFDNGRDEIAFDGPTWERYQAKTDLGFYLKIKFQMNIINCWALLAKQVEGGGLGCLQSFSYEDHRMRKGVAKKQQYINANEGWCEEECVHTGEGNQQK